LSLVLFDIDGTLLLSGGAGVRAMTLAFERAFGVGDAFAGIQIGGRTDTFLLSQAFQQANLPDDRAEHDRFQRVYLECLAGEIHKPGTGRRGVMPGVGALLPALRDDRRFHLALLTGNYEGAARIKLESFGLGGYFAWGVFGEESADRNELARIALARAETRRVPRAASEAAVVIGDTPHDVECAHAIGARALGVATGSFSSAELAAAGADVVLENLSETAAVVELLLAVGGGSAWESNPACPRKGSDRF
jgi:phosphoglycolate phosphatase